MFLFYTPDLEIGQSSAMLGAEESHHAVVTLRMRNGDPVCMTNGRGAFFEGCVTDNAKSGCTVAITSHRTEPALPYHLHMAVAPTKNIDRYEWFLEKATEIGLDRITPLLCAHSERKSVRLDRSEKVVLSAVKQSLKAYTPQVDEMEAFATFVSRDFGADTGKFIGYCSDEFQKIELRDAVARMADKNAVVLIGPEGDFAPEEVALAVGHGFIPITLGTSRLRTETAALMSVATIAIVR